MCIRDRFLILSESGYYSSAEQAKFRQEAAALKKLPPPEYARQKGDYMFERKQYGKAAAIYEKITGLPKGGAVTDEFLEKVWCSLGCTQARMFQFQKAGASFEKAYSFRKSEDILKRMYYLSRTGEGMTDRKHHLPLVNEEQRLSLIHISRWELLIPGTDLTVPVW